MKILKVLVACEESQAVCKAFRELGHKAYSNDVIECSGGYPEWHLQMDCFDAIKLKEWDLMIAHPPCTYICSGSMNWINKEIGRRAKMNNAISFVKKLFESDIKHIAIENPIGVLSTRFRKPDQIFRVYEFGHSYKKDVCLWLKNLPKLTPTKIAEKPYKTFDFWSSNRIKPNGGNRKSETFPGVAAAMAQQWSEFILNENNFTIIK